MVECLKRLKIGEVKKAVMKNFTTYKVGGKVLALVYPNDIKSLRKLIKYLESNKIKYKVIGNGSNLIFSDKGYNGVIIKLSCFKEYKSKGNLFTVGAGYNLIGFSLKVSNLGYKGLEFVTGIPGTIGGAVFTNAGAYNEDISKHLVSIKVLTPEFKIKTLKNKDLNFSYRNSFLKENPKYICLNATFKLNRGNKEEILNLIEDRRKRRILSQPLEYPSAGSVFRNPNGLYAGKLIEDLGYKGKYINEAYVSEKHANFIINKGNAKSVDIKRLICTIKKDVRKKYKIDLILEQEIVN